jgi:hypothetical protein
MESGLSARAVVTTWDNMGLPPTECKTLGNWLRMRLPSPAARMITTRFTSIT